MKVGTLSFLLAASLPAQAALYPYYYSDSGAIPQGGTTFSVEHSIHTSGNPISGVQLILTFNNGYDLNGNIAGALILDPAGSPTYVSFTASGAGLSSGVGGQEIYTATFSGPPGLGGFNGLNPNGTWGLNLWDNNTSGIENGLVSWQLDITSPQVVPEPVNLALGIFAGVAALGLGVGALRKRTAKVVQPAE